MTQQLEIANAGVRYGRSAAAVQALQGVSLRIQAGERVALVGANGCGKSTLLRLMHGLIAPSEGTVRHQVGVQQAMLFQRPYLMRLSVLNNVALGLWLRGTPWAQSRDKALHALQRVGMDALVQRPARKLSGGQQQRVALARAWALSPQVLLLDEPTASLDPHAKREVEALIGDLARQGSGMTVLFASHNLGQVKRLATRVVYLEHGRVLADLPVQDFFGGTLLQTDYPQAHLFVKGELA
ncbi:MAG TPA: phosphate ABC transporter ATP-binding protein [Rhodoferax sp.]|nr:phosphate ABC transporter ATP-binding protein [Rhodoferax sp.]